MNIANCRPTVQTALCSRGYTLHDIEDMSAKDISHEFCEWEGLIN